MGADLRGSPQLVELIGRAPELDRLRDLVAATVSGRGALVVVAGEPGIGKTALLDALAAECEGAGLSVLRGAGTELEQQIPFQTIHECLASGHGEHRPDVAKVMSQLRAAGGEAAAGWESSVTEAAVEVVDEWCAHGPGALVVDDVHWADGSTQLLFQRLQRALPTLPLLITLAIQPGEPRSCFAASHPTRLDPAAVLRALRADGAIVLDLAPLGDAEVLRLAERLSGPARPSPALLAGLSAAAGNPLYVHELISAHEQRAAARDREATATGIGFAPDASAPSDPAAPTDASAGDDARSALPGSLTATILDGLQHLPRPTRQVLEEAAVLGSRVYLSELATVLGMPVMKLWEALSAPVQAGLLVDAGDRLVFRHDLVRQALADGVPQSARTALRVQAWQSLAAAGAPVERAAEYLVLADSYEYLRIVDWLVRDVAALAVRAPAMAVELLERTLPLMDGDDPRTRTLRGQLARALLRAGDPASAQRAATQALDAGGGVVVGETDLRWLLAQSVFQQGRVDESVAVAEAALASPQVHGATAARFQALAAQGHYLLGNPTPCAQAARRTVEMGESSSDPYTTAFGHCLLAILRLSVQESAEALELVDRSLVQLANQEIRPDLQMAPHLIRGLALMDLERGPEAHQAFDAALHDCEHGGNVFLTWYHLGKARLGYAEGWWDDALAEVDAGLEGFDGLGLGQSLRSQASLIAVHRGDNRTAAHLADRSTLAHRPTLLHPGNQPDDTPGGRNQELLRQWATALVREADGAPDRALDLLLEVWTQGVRSLPLASLHALGPDLARLASMSTDPGLLTTVGDALDDLAATRPAQCLRATALLCRAAEARDPDRLEEAARSFSRVGRRLYVGYAREQAAVTLAALDRSDEARAELHAALDVYGTLGAAWDARRAEERLTAAGVAAGRRAKRSPGTGWDALSGTEREIVALVSQGFSNPDIGARMYLSHRTVQSHLTTIFSKLGVGSRVELAVMAHQREPGPPIGTPH